LGIDEYGLHSIDRRVIEALLARDNKPIGSAALACSAKTTKGDLETVVEPRLEYVGFLERTPKGRMLTPKAMEVYGPKPFEYSEDCEVEVQNEPKLIWHYV
jgi:Holliday junction DNA helicase RuvB